MFPFRSRIDPFSAFTINLGPLYVERVFDSLLTREGVKGMVQINGAEHYALYLDYLKTNINVHSHTQYAVTQFYKGYFYQQLAEREDESRFYAQWQMGILQDILNYSWPLIEESLQKAAAIDPMRGEPVKTIVEHYIENREWRRAYLHSKISMERYFDKNPVADRRWYVDFDAYNSTVLTRHQQICLHNTFTHGKASTETVAEQREI